MASPNPSRADFPEPELSGLELEAVLAHSPRSSVLLVARDGVRFVLRLSEDAAALGAELGAFSRVSDAGLVAPVEWGRTASGRSYLLRPFVEGVPFDEALRALDDRGARDLVVDLLGAIDRLHRAGLVHRDIKASNVLVQDGKAILVDLDLLGDLEGEGRAAGSRDHIAPEVLLGQAHRRAADLFSVGAMLAYALCGEPSPSFSIRFPRSSFWQASELDAGSIPHGLGPLVRALLRRHPSDRPSSVRDAIALVAEVRAPAPRSVRLPLLAGRERFPDEVAKALAEDNALLIVRVADPEELAEVGDEIQLQSLAHGRAAQRRPLGEAPTTGALTIEIGPGPAELALRSLRGALVDGAGLVLVLAEDTAAVVSEALSREFLGDERHRVREVGFPLLRPEALEIHLRELARGSSPTSIRRLAGSLLQRTGGRRFAVNRILRLAEQRGYLRGAGSDWARLESLDLPVGGVTEDERASQASLGRTARELLLATALLDEPRTLGLLERTCALTRADALEGLNELQRCGALAPGFGPAGEVGVDDPRWLSIARETAAPEELRAVHARAASALRDTGADEQRVAAQELAADVDGSALGGVLDVGERALPLGLPWTATVFAREVLERLDDLAPADRRGAGLADLRTRAAVLLARAELARGEAKEALLSIARAFGAQLSSAPPAALLVAAEAEEAGGHRAAARGLYERALDNEPTREEELRARLGIAYSIHLDGDPEQALARIEGLPRADDPAGIAGTILNLRGGALAGLGRLREAHAALDLAMERAALAGDPTLVGRTELNRAFVQRREGRLELAAASLRRAIEAFETADHDKLRSLATNNLAVLSRDRGELTSATGLLEESLSQRRRLGDAHGTVVTLANLGFVTLDAGQIGPALNWLEQAGAQARRGNYELELGVIGAHLALASALAGRTEEASRALEEPAVLALAGEHEGVVARARAALSVFAGDASSAVELLETAVKNAGAGERFRLARHWLALRPESLGARKHLDAAASALESPVREAEAAWLGRSPSVEADGERIVAWLELFEEAGRTDLVRATALALAERCQRGGRSQGRRRAMARAEAAAEAMVDELSAEERGGALARLGRLSGSSPSPAESGSLDVEWLLSWNQRLAREQEEEELLAATVDTALEVTGAERGFLVLLDGERIDVHVARGMGEKEMLPEDVRFSQTVVRQALAARRTISTRNAGQDPRFARAESIRSMSLKSILCVPLPAVDGLTGALYLDGGDGDTLFDDYDIEAARALADQASIAIANHRRRRELVRLNERLQERLTLRDREVVHMQRLLRSHGTSPPVGSLLGGSPAMCALLDLVARFAPTDLPALLTGPGGSEIAQVARAIHANGPRSSGPFVSVNLAALPPEDIAAELFGEPPAEDEVRGRVGRVARAHGGTLFLDSIECLPPAVQASLFDAIERRRVRTRRGKARPADVRVLTASRADLAARVESGAFLSELFHTLREVEIAVPPLADRVEDIPVIARARLDELNRLHDTKKRFSPNVLAALARRAWPGEMRELVGEITRLYHVADELIGDPALIRSPETTGASNDAMPASFRLEDIERAAVLRALEATRNNKERSAKLLGVSRAGLYKKLKRLGLEDSVESRAPSRRQGK